MGDFGCKQREIKIELRKAHILHILIRTALSARQDDRAADGDGLLST